MRPAARWVSHPAAIWDRPALCTQTNRTDGLPVVVSVALSGTGGLLCGAEQAAAGQADVDQGDQDGDLDERADHAREGLAGGDAEDPDRYGDGQLEVVAGGGEGERGRLVVR